jgi:hypothetical protein
MFHTFIKQIGFLIGHTLLVFYICALLCGFFELPGGQYGMSPFLLLTGSLVLFGIYIIWTIVYFFAKRKILNTSRIIIYYTIAFFSLIIFEAMGNFYDIINLVFILSVTISSAIIYFLNKVLNEDNFNKLIS